jgi:ABC-type transport system involved in multi-copper enzyme maturation permease subunit
MFLRELHAALLNRYFQVFSALALLGGISAAVFAEDANASAFFVLQIALYFVSLFAVLVGVSSARAESEEWPMLFTQPVPRAAYPIGKFCALWAIFSGVLLLLFVPAVFAGAAWSRIATLYFQTLGLAAAFGSVGLCAGFLARDRVQGLIFGVSAWLLLLFGVDLIALFAARWPLMQKTPDLWVAALMLNPLDAFRIQALFAMEQIPAEAANKTPLASWWIAHASAWFPIIACIWTGALLWLTSARLRHWEE